MSNITLLGEKPTKKGIKGSIFPFLKRKKKTKNPFGRAEFP